MGIPNPNSGSRHSTAVLLSITHGSSPVDFGPAKRRVFQAPWNSSRNARHSYHLRVELSGRTTIYFDPSRHPESSSLRNFLPLFGIRLSDIARGVLNFPIVFVAFASTYCSLRSFDRMDGRRRSGDGIGGGSSCGAAATSPPQYPDR